MLLWNLNFIIYTYIIIWYDKTIMHGVSTITHENYTNVKLSHLQDDGIVISERVFLVPLGFCLLKLFDYSLSVSISDSESFIFIRALIACFFAVEWRPNLVLTCFLNPMLDSLWVEIFLKVIHTRRCCRVVMMMLLPYFRTVMVNLEVISCWANKWRNLGFLSVMTVNNSVCYVPIGSSPG